MRGLVVACTVLALCWPVGASEPGICGNGVIEAGEDCDIGGTCIGNAMAGRRCTSDADCGGSSVGGVCAGADKNGAACT